MDRKHKALEVVAKVSGKDVASLSPEQQLVGDLNIDSPKALQLLVELEDTLEIEISDEDAAQMDTVGDVLSFLGSLA